MVRQDSLPNPDFFDIIETNINYEKFNFSYIGISPNNHQYEWGFRGSSSRGF